LGHKTFLRTVDGETNKRLKPQIERETNGKTKGNREAGEPPPPYPARRLFPPVHRRGRAGARTSAHASAEPAPAPP